MDAVTRLLSQLVAIPSVNPMGRPLEGPEFLEGRVTDFLEDYFRGLRVDYQRRPVSPGRENIVAVFEPAETPKGRTTLLWDAHQDTVPTDGMTIPPFEPRIVGDRMYGRGACDIKGGMAAMLIAFARLVEGRPAGAARVVMACTVDEEFTHTGSDELAERLADGSLRADLGIVAEPTGLDVVPTHKGAVRWKIRTHGRACHSSTPHLGDNAIYRMARVVAALEEHASELAGAPPDPILGPPSLSVGRIEGGISVNAVPDACQIEIDRRVIPGEAPVDCQARVEAFLRARLGAGEMERVEALPPWVSMPALVPRVPAGWIEAIRQVIQTTTGRTPEVRGVPYGTDAGPLGQGGLPCIVLGPGDIAQAHTEDEWVDLRSVRAACDVYYELARQLGSLAAP